MKASRGIDIGFSLKYGTARDNQKVFEMEFVLLWIAVGVITALAANARGRSWLAWFALGFIFSVFALIAVLVMKDLSKERQD